MKYHISIAVLKRLFLTHRREVLGPGAVAIRPHNLQYMKHIYITFKGYISRDLKMRRGGKKLLIYLAILAFQKSHEHFA